VRTKQNFLFQLRQKHDFFNMVILGKIHASDLPNNNLKEHEIFNNNFYIKVCACRQNLHIPGKIDVTRSWQELTSWERCYGLDEKNEALSTLSGQQKTKPKKPSVYQVPIFSPDIVEFAKSSPVDQIIYALISTADNQLRFENAQQIFHLTRPILSQAFDVIIKESSNDKTWVKAEYARKSVERERTELSLQFFDAKATYLENLRMGNMQEVPINPLRSLSQEIYLILVIYRINESDDAQYEVVFLQRNELRLFRKCVE